MCSVNNSLYRWLGGVTKGVLSGQLKLVPIIQGGRSFGRVLTKYHPFQKENDHMIEIIGFYSRRLSVLIMMTQQQLQQKPLAWIGLSFGFSKSEAKKGCLYFGGEVNQKQTKTSA